MSNVNNGPSAAVSNNMQAGLQAHISTGVTTFANLPPASRHGPEGTNYQTAWTSDQGLVYSNGTAWVGLATASNTPFSPGTSLPAGVTTVQLLGKYTAANSAVPIYYDMTTAEAQAVIDSASSAVRDVVFGPGTHVARGTLTLPTSVSWRVYGHGPGNTVLTPDASGNTVLQFATGAASQGACYLGGFGILGTKTGSGHGIYIPAAVTGISRLMLDDIGIEKMGGHGIYDLKGAFTTKMNKVWVDDCVDHLFDLIGANTTLLDTCYALNVPTAGKAGFRIHAGNPTLLNCNGVNSGQYWGIFSDDVAGEGSIQYCSPTLIGCNIEAFSLVGVLNKTSNFNIINCKFTSGASSTTKAIAYNQQPLFIGSMDGATRFTLGSGASWTSGQPIHARNAPPFIYQQIDNAGTGYYAYYDDDNAGSGQVSAWSTFYTGALGYGVAINDVRANRNFWLGTGGIFDSTGSGTPEGAVTAPIGSTYRNTAGAASTTFYVKTSGTGNTGWTAK